MYRTLYCFWGVQSTNIKCCDFDGFHCLSTRVYCVFLIVRDVGAGCVTVMAGCVGAGCMGAGCMAAMASCVGGE